MGLLDWLTDGSLFGSSSASADAPTNNFLSGTASLYPPDAPSPTAPSPAAPAPAAPSTPALPPDPTGGVAAPPAAPDPTYGVQAPDPTFGVKAPDNLAAAVPTPTPTPAPAPAAAPPAVIPAGPAGAPTGITPSPATATPAAAGNGGGFMGRFASAIGGGLGAGLTAAGNSAGKSPFQAFASGAGATMSGVNDEEHKNTKDAQGYLHAAIEAKRANDDAGYKSNYVQYLLKSSQEKAASKDAAANKNDSPTQLTLGALREVNNDSGVDLSSKRVQQLMKDRGADDPLVLEAVKQHAELVKQKQLEAFARVGVNPKTADEFMKMPGITQDNPIDAEKLGLTKDNITKKLQPGQYYINPADKKVYQYKGPTPAVGSSPSTPAPVDPMNPARGTMPAIAPAAIAEAP